MTHARKTLALNVLIAALIAGSLTACASDPEPAPSPHAQTTLKDLQGAAIASPIGLVFAAMDANGDTLVQAEEVDAAAPGLFATGDANTDGVITPLEFNTWSHTHLGSTYAKPGRLDFDRNQDNQIDPLEFAMVMAGIHDRLDRDKNGALERAELLVSISGTGVDVNAMRREMEDELRRKMQEAMRRRR